MNGRDDLTQFLQSWPHEAGKINARRIAGDDGRQKLQIRIELGVLQMEMAGRPDGDKPQGYETLLALQQDRLKRYRAEAGTDTGFVLSPNECQALRDEALQFYHRYVGLFTLSDYSGVVRDTAHNLAIFDLCRDYGSSSMDRTALEQFRAPVLMMQARGAAELAITAGRTKDALAALDRGLDDIRTVFDDAGRPEMFDRANEVELLRGMRDALVPKLPPSQKAELAQRLKAAIEAENFELAAILRDELRLMKE